MVKNKNKNKGKTGNSELPSEPNQQQNSQQYKVQPNQSKLQPNEASQIKQKVEKIQQNTKTQSELLSTKVQLSNQSLTKDKTPNDNNETVKGDNTTGQTVLQTFNQQQPSKDAKVQQPATNVQNQSKVKQEIHEQINPQPHSQNQELKPSVQEKIIENQHQEQKINSDLDARQQQKYKQNLDAIQKEKHHNDMILIEIPESRQNLQGIQEVKDVHINIETSADFQNLQESQQAQQKLSKNQVLIEQPIKTENQKHLVQQIPQLQPHVMIQQLHQIPTFNPLQSAQVVQTQVVYVQQNQPISVEKLIEKQEEIKPKQQKQQPEEPEEKPESLLISQSDNSDFIKKQQIQPKIIPHVKLIEPVVEPQQMAINDLPHHSVESKVEQHSVKEQQLEVSKSQISSQQQKEQPRTPMFNSVKTQSMLIESQLLLIDSYPSNKQQSSQQANPSIQQLKNELKNVQSIIIQSTNTQVPRRQQQTLLNSNQKTQSILLSSQQSQTVPILTPSDIENLRAKNQEEQVKRRKLKQQQEHQRWTRFYEQKRKRQEEQRKRYDQEMKRVKEQEEKKKLRQQKEQVDKEDTQVKKNLQKLKDIKKDVEEQSPFGVKLGISIVASLAVGGLTWLGKRDAKVSAFSAIASLALVFIVQK